MSIDYTPFNRITFALPVQPFKVTAFISTQERLPAVTEFVLRLLHTCGRVSLAAFREYFGFPRPRPCRSSSHWTGRAMWR